MKFYCSTKKFEGKQEAHAIASKLDGAAFLCIARLSDADQNDPKKVKEALKKEFDKVAVDHETAVSELAQLKRQDDETPAQLAWRVEKITRKAYPGLSEVEENTAAKTYKQMLQDKFLVVIDDDMSKRLKNDGKYRDMNITTLAEELERLELIYKRKPHFKPTTVNEIKTTEDTQPHNLRQIVKEEIEARPWGRQISGRGRFGNYNRGRGKPRNSSRPRWNGAEGKPKCFHCESEHHFRKDCPFVHLCQRCWKPGHVARNCQSTSPVPSPSLNYQAAGNNQEI